MTKRSTVLLAAALLAGCASSGSGLDETLDPVTSVTVTSTQVPLVFYRDNTSRSAYAREFLNVVPVEINRTGSFRYFLWVGAWSTTENGMQNDRYDMLASIVIVADGEPLQLEAAGATPGAIGASRPVGIKPVAGAAEAYYPVTLDQIDMLARAKDIRLRTAGSDPREFEPWDTQRAARQNLSAFVDNARF